MSKRALTLAAYLAAAAAVPFAVAQTQPDIGWTPPPADIPAPDETTPEEGVDLIERGAGILLRDLMDRIGPQLNQLTEDMSGAMEQLGPAVGDLARLVDDMRNYDAPQRLENGDILIRRKAGAPPPPAVGDGLRPFTETDKEPSTPLVPVDPFQPQTEL